MPPSAMTAQFSNSNGGMVRSCFQSTAGRGPQSLFRAASSFVLFHAADIPQPLRHYTAGGGRDVDADPLAIELLRGD